MLDNKSQAAQFLDATFLPFPPNKSPPPPYHNYDANYKSSPQPHPQQNINVHMSSLFRTEPQIFYIHQEKNATLGGGAPPGEKIAPAAGPKIEVVTGLMLDYKARRVLFVRKIFSVLFFHMLITIGGMIFARSKTTPNHNVFRSDIANYAAIGATIIGVVTLITCFICKPWRNRWWMKATLSSCVIYLAVCAVATTPYDTYYQCVLFFSVLAGIFGSSFIFTFQPWLDFNPLTGISLALVSSAVVISSMWGMVKSEIKAQNVSQQPDGSDVPEKQEGSEVIEFALAAVLIGICIVVLTCHVMVSVIGNFLSSRKFVGVARPPEV
ncbi:uncharacterized protein LOC110854874 [Folsomia candida]|uniref:uncharacterized protein LOC110854874 n=1 Tax=Folsomia candida TaxID=158441 RepID=UPI00160524D9|nr:uncharacterized protein LOC110854874 [Folsomia candida]XP_035711657.1 uncharacterized protein LOC110854874 [Folsomia candida]